MQRSVSVVSRAEGLTVRLRVPVGWVKWLLYWRGRDCGGWAGIANIMLCTMVRGWGFHNDVAGVTVNLSQ